MHIAIIGGAGTVGTTVAYTLAIDRPEVDISLLDIDEEGARGHGIDTRHARTFSQLSQFGGSGPMGSVTAGSVEDGSLADADIAIVTASAPRPEATAERGGRAAFLDQNLSLGTEIAAELRRHDPIPVIVVSNPVDRVTYRIWRELGWDRSRVMGYTLSETARAADKIASLREAPVSDVYCPVVGEHGEDVVPVYSRLQIDGESVTLTDAEQTAVRDYIRNIPYDVINLRGQEETSRWVTGQGVAQLTSRLIDGGRETDHIALSVPLDGEYGLEDVCVSVPVKLGRGGLEQILNWELSESEQERLHAAAKSIQADIKSGSG